MKHSDAQTLYITLEQNQLVILVAEIIIDTIALFIKTVPKKLVMAVLNGPDVGDTNQ